MKRRYRVSLRRPLHFEIENQEVSSRKDAYVMNRELGLGSLWSLRFSVSAASV